MLSGRIQLSTGMYAVMALRYWVRLPANGHTVQQCEPWWLKNLAVTLHVRQALLVV